MKMKNKILFSVLLPGVALVLAFMGIIAIYTKANINIEVSQLLQEDADITAEFIDSYFDEKKSQLTGVTYISYIKDCMETMSGGSGINCTATELSDYLSNTVLFTSVDSVKISLLSLQGKIVASTNGDQIGEDMSQNEIFRSGKGGFYISDVYRPNSQAQFFVYDIAAPVVKNNKTVGVIVSSLVAEKLNEFLEIGFENYKTADRYFINTEGLMVTPSRYLENTVLQQRVNTVGSRACFDNLAGYLDNNQNNEILIYPDYRDVKVFGAYAYMPKVKWCLMSEIVEKEAKSVASDLISFFCIISLVIIGILYLVAWNIGDRVSNPIKKLAHLLDVIEKGSHFDYKVGTKSKDELGHLTRTIDRILARLHKTKDNK